MTTDERYEIDDPDKRRALMTLAALVEEQTPDGMGFAVFLFDFGVGGSMFYLANAQRDDVVSSMKEWIAKQEKTKG